MSKLELKKTAQFAYEWFVDDVKVGGRNAYFSSKKLAQEWKKNKNLSIDNYSSINEEAARIEAQIDAESEKTNQEFLAACREGKVRGVCSSWGQ